MKDVRRYFLFLILIGPLHMAEQVLTGLEELHAIRRLLARYHALYPQPWSDAGAIVLITIVWTALSLPLLAALHGGRPRLFVAAIFGLFGAQEIHHLFESIAKRGYDPGLLTCLPYAAFGALLLRAVWRELRPATTPANPMLTTPAKES